MEFLKKLIIGIFVLSISSGIFFLLLKDQNVRDDILKTTLEMFGEELLAMVPDSPQKKSLAAKYQDFIKKAENNEIPQEEVERVIATTLNIQNAKAELNASEALALLDVKVDSSHSKSRSMHNNDFPVKVWPAKPPRHNKDFVFRLERMNKFQKEMEMLGKEDSTMRELRKQVTYLPNDGVQAHVNIQFLDKIPKEHREDFKKEFKELEELGLLKFYKPDSAQKIIEFHLKNTLKYLKPAVYSKIEPDSLYLPQFFDSLRIDIGKMYNPDSLEKFINGITKGAPAYIEIKK